MTNRRKSEGRKLTIEETARRYFEFTLYGEPLVSPEQIFER